MRAEVLHNYFFPQCKLFTSHFSPSAISSPHSIISPHANINRSRTNTHNPLPLQRHLIIRQKINHPIPIRAPQQRPKRISILIRILRRPRKRARNIFILKRLIEDGFRVCIIDFAAEEIFDAGVVGEGGVGDPGGVGGQAAFDPHPPGDGGELPGDGLAAVGEGGIVVGVVGVGG